MHKPLLTLAALCLLLPAMTSAQDVKKYIRYQKDGAVAYGQVEGDKVRKLEGEFANFRATDQVVNLADVEILVPTTPSKVIALAGNYKDHLGADSPVPANPEPFFKLASCLQKHEGVVIQPKDTEPVHYEAEVVIVIGKTCKNVSEADAMNYVFGVTCGNDISARVWQKNDKQWWRAKGSDTFGPVGPYIVSGVDYNNLEISLRVNGEERQRSNTKVLIHGIASTIAFISKSVTLEPGDLIYTGTPGQTQGMNPGDVVEVEIEGVGVLRNKIVAQP